MIQRQSLPAVHAGLFLRELHVAHFSGGVRFLPCAAAWYVNATMIATVHTTHRSLRTILLTATSFRLTSTGSEHDCFMPPPLAPPQRTSTLLTFGRLARVWLWPVDTGHSRLR